MTGLQGDLFLKHMAALASRHRLRIMASLAADGRQYVSQLARDVGLSRPLLQLHLQKLEEAGLVRSRLELSPAGKALNFYEVCEVDIRIDPLALVEASRTVTPERGEEWHHISIC
jgi:DNA-binding transcriptional ArsR family regulator